MTIRAKILQDPPFPSQVTGTPFPFLVQRSGQGHWASDSCQGPNDGKTRQGNCDGLRPLPAGRTGAVLGLIVGTSGF